ncbi:MAG: hypothetical protein JRJ68_13225 [Deltaproteobacteria bacterium]|nr:hypothetical protein [Deltaproteobacteria bacterium]
MTELLMIKAGENYFRFTDKSYLQCELSRGSVFPLDGAEEVKELCTTLHEDGISDARLVKLTIVEEPYQEKASAGS